MFQIIAKISKQLSNVIIKRNFIVTARIIDMLFVVNEFQHVLYDEMKNTKSNCIVNWEFVLSKYQIVLSIKKKEKSFSIFLFRIADIFCQLKFVLYSTKIFFRNAEFISISETVNKASSTFFSVFVKDFHSSCFVFALASLKNASETMCCLSKLCLMFRLNYCK